MESIKSDRAFKVIIVIIGIILVVDIINQFLIGGPSIFSLVFKSGNAVSASEISPLNSTSENFMHMQPEENATGTRPAGSSSDTSQAIYVPTKATPVPTVQYVSVVTPIMTTSTESAVRSSRPAMQTTQEQDEYVAIYSNDLSYIANTVPTAVAFDVANPPLIIKYTVSPLMIEDSKYFYNHTGTNAAYDDLLNVTRPSETAVFTVTIYNKETGQEIDQDGYGGLYGIYPEKTYYLRQAGKYLLQFEGRDSSAHVDMYLKREGNLI